MHPLGHYKTLVFDCDGVVLNSNPVKTEAFFKSVSPFGKTSADALVSYHVANGGISRYEKFAHYLNRIAPECLTAYKKPTIDDLLNSFSNHVRTGLLSCDIAPGLLKLRQRVSDARWLIVSGGDQFELRDIFTQRGLVEYFDGGIFGSPDTKEVILQRELSRGNIMKPALFLGDSKYDYEVSKSAGLDFLFLSGWSEVLDWESWVKANQIESIQSLRSLINSTN